MEEKQVLHDKEIKELIFENLKTFGYHLAFLESTNYLPGFAYTIGLFKNYNHPEVICFGLKSEALAAVLNHLCDRIKKGEIFTSQKLYNGFLQVFPIQFLEVKKEHYPDYVGYAGWFYEMTSNFPLLQLVWPDKQPLFPWEPSFNPDWKFQQPLLDRNIDFKFYEERNLAVYTTKQALEGDPILYVYHNEDGDWQFHTSSEPDLEDAKIVCLEEITKLDPSINNIYFLEFGENAWRSSRYDEWQYESCKSSE